jgi:hypothetical protein
MDFMKKGEEDAGLLILDRAEARLNYIVEKKPRVIRNSYLTMKINIH